MMQREKMESGYQSAVRFAETFGVQQYNLGLAEQVGVDIHSLQDGLVDRLIGSTAIGPNSRVVDVGCGIGGATQRIAQRHKPDLVVGLELCWPNIHFALSRRNGSNGVQTRFLQGDAHRLPVATQSVDVVFNLESAFHYPDKGSFLRECYRVLRPGGVLLLGDLVLHRWMPRFLADSQGAHFWTEERYRDTLSSVGFRIDSSEDVTPLVHNSIQTVIGFVRKEPIGRVWPCRRCVLGVMGAGFMLRWKRLRYMLFRTTRPANP